jgi:hypothetical protein
MLVHEDVQITIRFRGCYLMFFNYTTESRVNCRLLTFSQTGVTHDIVLGK